MILWNLSIVLWHAFFQKKEAEHQQIFIWFIVDYPKNSECILRNLSAGPIQKKVWKMQFCYMHTSISKIVCTLFLLHNQKNGKGWSYGNFLTKYILFIQRRIFSLLSAIWLLKVSEIAFDSYQNVADWLTDRSTDWKDIRNIPTDSYGCSCWKKFTYFDNCQMKSVTKLTFVTEFISSKYKHFREYSRVS